LAPSTVTVCSSCALDGQPGCPMRPALWDRTNPEPGSAPPATIAIGIALGIPSPSLTIEAVPGLHNPWWKAVAINVYEFFSSTDESRPSLVARNERGGEVRLFTVQTWDQAVERRDELRRELVTSGIDAWCSRYKIPATFVGGDRPPTPGSSAPV
jgi:hypothetical protein